MTTKTIAYQDGETELKGYLAYDETKTSGEKLPGVLVLPEWWGLNEYAEGRAEEIAALGYVGFAVDMYGGGKTTTDAKEAGAWAGQFYGKPLMAARAQAGLDALLAGGLVDPGKVGAIGYCFGGSAALALAYSGAPLAGIVSFHAGLIPVPPGAAAKTKAKFLLCNGAIDPLVKPDDVAKFVASMNEAKFDYQFINYSGAVHAFTNPEADEVAQRNHMVGMIGYNAAADRRSFAAMESFLGEIFS